MQEEYFRLKHKILHQLEGANEELKMLESKIHSTSLLKVQLIETTTHSGLFFKKKNSHKKNKVMPNELLLGWVQTVILEIHEQYASALEASHRLGEFGPEISKKIHALMQSCFTCHLHLRAFEKKDLNYFSSLSRTSDSITLHRAEKIIEECICDLRIAKETFLQDLRKECSAIPFEVQANV